MSTRSLALGRRPSTPQVELLSGARDGQSDNGAPARPMQHLAELRGVPTGDRRRACEPECPYYDPQDLLQPPFFGAVIHSFGSFALATASPLNSSASNPNLVISLRIFSMVVFLGL